MISKFWKIEKPQEIAEVGDAEKVPLEIAILFDISGTTNPMFEFEQETAAKFLREVMRPEDRATIFTIGEDPIMVQSRDTAEKSAISIKNNSADKTIYGILRYGQSSVRLSGKQYAKRQTQSCSSYFRWRRHKQRRRKTWISIGLCFARKRNKYNYNFKDLRNLS